MIVFYRILGNDIPVRHRPNQTLVNLSFILRNEAEFPRCEKRFLLNRIVDPQIRKKLQSIIGAAGLRCDEIPFLPDDYCGLGSAVEKALYLTNQNAARNRCIDLGLADADTVLPFDGQVFFSVNGWSDMVDALGTPDAEKYLAVPMFRLRENRHALAPWHPGLDDVDHLWAEPQIVVRRGHDIRFNERLSYGEANKVELLMRLGIPGPWDEWVGRQFQKIRANLAATRSLSSGRICYAGFVLRLESGKWKAERSTSFRAHARRLGLDEFVERVDRQFGRRISADD
jgi:hypothetical protein